MAAPSLPDLYISADVEADGPIPGPYSMLSFAFAVAGSFDGKTFRVSDPSEQTFYRELRPISDRWLTEAVAVSDLDRDELARSGADPARAMQEAAAWIDGVDCEARQVLVAYPLGFDWMFLYCYFIRFTGGSPFGFSRALDSKTIYQQKARVTVERAGRDDLPAALRSARPHTHNALDDAIEQAEIFNRLFSWQGHQRNAQMDGAGEAEA